MRKVEVEDFRATVTAAGDDMRDEAVGFLMESADRFPNARLTFGGRDRAEVWCPDTRTLWVFVRATA